MLGSSPSTWDAGTGRESDLNATRLFNKLSTNKDCGDIATLVRGPKYPISRASTSSLSRRFCDSSLVTGARIRLGFGGMTCCYCTNQKKDVASTEGNTCIKGSLIRRMKSWSKALILKERRQTGHTAK